MCVLNNIKFTKFITLITYYFVSDFRPGIGVSGYGVHEEKEKRPKRIVRRGALRTSPIPHT